MKRTILVFGLIAGVIVAVFMNGAMLLTRDNPNCGNSTGMMVGYASMLLAFSFVFVGIKNFRDKYNNGSVTFGKAFKLGLYIMLIASTVYVIAWVIDYYCFIPDFMDKYSAHMIDQAKASGKTPAELNAEIQEIDHMREMYKNPIIVVLLTYAEILPVGLLVSLISALILKRRPVTATPEVI